MWMRNSHRVKYLIYEIKVPLLRSKFAYLNEREVMMVWMDSYYFTINNKWLLNWDSIRMDELYFILVLDFLFINYLT